MSITAEYLLNRVEASDAIEECLGTVKTETQLCQFLRCYADWNSTFASGVTALTSLVGRHRELFEDAGAPRAVNDRSIYVASHIFDAARDEYDDGAQAHRDPHRSLAQAMLIALAQLTNNTAMLEEEERDWLKQYHQFVIDGYTGAQSVEYRNVFYGMGYHLGSELLADQEFSKIDAFMRSNFNDLVQKLMRTTVEIHGSKHRCYAWVGIHSGAGGGVEMDHFDAGLQAANLALEYLNERYLSREHALEAIVAGFRQFASEQRLFFDLTRHLMYTMKEAQ